MSRKWLLALITFFILTSCNAPEPWSQFHANGSNQGFILVNSGIARQPKWSVPIGKVAYSSPALGANGDVYVGTTDGELVAVGSNGNLRWKKIIAVNSAIVSSPAVGLDNNIYIISVPKDPNTYWSSTLHSVTPDGNINWSRNFPDGFTTGSAKTWTSNGKTYVFVHITKVPYTQLVIFDQNSNEIHRENVCGAEITGGYPIPSDWWRIFTGGMPFVFQTPPSTDPLGPLYPTVAIVDFKNLSPDQPIIIVADNACGIRAYQWSPPKLSNKWNQYNRETMYSSPAVDGTGLVVVGRKDGHIVAYDMITGAQQWDYDAQEPIVATPALFASYVFAASLDHFHIIDSRDGRLAQKVDSKGHSVASPALTANHVYLSTDAGLYTFDNVPNGEIFINRESSGGFSSPAVDKDGTVYVVTSSGELQAFPPH
jgi:outer membrane protein assembly factor BamB